MLTRRFDSALLFASWLHREQCRKGGTPPVPYVAHLLAVTGIVLEDGGGEDEAIAALLHDSVEDQSHGFAGGRQGLRDYIGETYGAEVLRIVDGCTDDDGFEKGAASSAGQERVLWRRRKERYVAHIRSTHEPRLLRVSCADKVHNAASLIEDYERAGDQVWQRFRTRDRGDQLWYYDALARAFAEAAPGRPLTLRLGRLAGALTRLA